MKIKLEKKIEIHSEDEWGRYAPPMSPDQWKNGRSAKLLAQYVLNTQFKTDLNLMLQSINFPQSDSYVGTPEAQTGLFKNDNRWPRHHDLLLRSEKSIIGIEAKVGESFDDYVEELLNNKRTSEEKKNRIRKICSCFNISTPAEKLKCRYQLLTGTLGTIVEAQKSYKELLNVKPNVKQFDCLFLILTFTGNVELRKGESQSDNKQDYLYFRNNILQKSSDGFVKSIPIEKGDKKEINFYIKYQEIEIPYNFILK